MFTRGTIWLLTHGHVNKRGMLNIGSKGSSSLCTPMQNMRPMGPKQGRDLDGEGEVGDD